MSTQTLLRSSVPVLVLAALATLAGVVPVGTAHAGDHLDRRWRASGGIGARFGSFLVDNAGVGTVIPGHIDGGLRKGRMWVYGEYSLMSLTLPEGELIARGVTTLGNGHGLMHRLGGNVRWSFGRAGERDGGVDLYAEAGLGMQMFRWDAGGVWARPDVALGIGGAGWGASRRKHGGFSVGLRIHLSRRDDAGLGAVSCAGPCDAPTKPTGMDRSFLFDMTVLFGR